MPKQRIINPKKWSLRWIMSFLLIFFFHGLRAQTEEGIKTIGNFSAEHLVREIFASGACETISNIKSVGAAEGLGYFENAANILGIDRGIILSTGTITNARGPNDERNITGNFNDGAGDPDLSKLATGRVYDAVGLEFDFVPLDSFVTFRYVFASEEYCEFVGSEYNDVFGFFISGPGINGGFTSNGANVALIPGSQDYVAINTVNHRTHAEYYVNNERPEDAKECGIPPGQSRYLQLMEYDGFTKVLTAKLKLSPCHTYHIRLLVGDVSDNYYDSAVFLEAGSFDLGGKVSISSISANAEVINEGCADGSFRLTRGPEDNPNTPLTIGVRVSELSTATESEDFVRLPRKVVIPAGVDYVDVPVKTLNDDREEPDETIILALDIPCACYTDSAFLKIRESPPLKLNVNDSWACPNDTTRLYASAGGGNPPFRFDWSNGASGDTLVISGQQTGAYQVTVTDGCGHQRSATAQVIAGQPPTAMLVDSIAICEGENGHLNVLLSGNPPWTLYYRYNDEEEIRKIDSIFTDNFRLPVLGGGRYELVNVRDAGCWGTATGYGAVTVRAMEVSSEVRDARCAGSSDGAITVRINGGSPPYQLIWADGAPAGMQRTQLSPGRYELTVIDAAGCHKVLEWTISSPPPILPPSVDCEALAEGKISVDTEGGIPPYRYALSDRQWSSASLFDRLTPGENYEVTIQDSIGCELTFNWLAPAPYAQGMIELPFVITLTLGDPFQFSPDYLIPSQLITEWLWTPNDYLSCDDCPNPSLLATETFTYTVRTTDHLGCEDEEIVVVEIDPRLKVFVPNVFSPNGDGENDELHVYANPRQVDRIISVSIFDRWGNALFHETDWPVNNDRHGWDGAVRGRPLDTGMYIYVVRVRLINGDEQTVKGGVLLSR